MPDDTEAAGGPDAEAYLRERVDDQLRYYESAAGRAKRTHFRIQYVIIAFAAAVPVVMNLPSEFGGTNLSVALRLSATAMSLTVAILSGLASFRKDGDLWLTFRGTEELLKQEKFLFQMQAGPYEDVPEDQSRLAMFTARVESLISAEHTKFRFLIQESKRPTKSNE